MTQAQLLVCCWARWYSLTAVHQAQLLMFGEDLEDPLRLLGVVSAEQGEESCDHSGTWREHFRGLRSLTCPTGSGAPSCARRKPGLLLWQQGGRCCRALLGQRLWFFGHRR